MDTGSEGRKPWVLRAIVIGSIALVAAVLLLRSAPESEGVTRLPTFSLASLTGSSTVTSASLEGKPVVINFWASWCEPCRREAPLLDRLHEEFEGRGLVVLGVDVQDVPIAAREFVEEYDLGYPIVEDLDQVLFGELKEADGLPQTYFVTAQGEIVSSGVAAPVLGELDEGELRDAISFLLEGAG